MSKNKLKRFAQGFIPFLAFNIPFPYFAQINQFEYRAPVDIQEEVKSEAMIIEARRAEKIDSYFRNRNMPLEGYGLKLVREAQKYELDWRLMPAIAVRESSGGKNACGNNPFGWGSCRIGFKSIDEAIETIARNISGNNPNTKKYYSTGDLYKKLERYNGRAVITYPEEVLAIMDSFEFEVLTFAK